MKTKVSSTRLVPPHSSRLNHNLRSLASPQLGPNNLISLPRTHLQLHTLCDPSISDPLDHNERPWILHDLESGPLEGFGVVADVLGGGGGGRVGGVELPWEHWRGRMRSEEEDQREEERGQRGRREIGASRRGEVGRDKTRRDKIIEVSEMDQKMKKRKRDQLSIRPKKGKQTVRAQPLLLPSSSSSLLPPISFNPFGLRLFGRKDSKCTLTALVIVSEKINNKSL